MTALLFLSVNPLFGNINSFEERCLWVVRNSLKNEHSIDEMIEFAKKNGFNNLLVQVRGRGDAYYNSQLVPKSEFLQDSEFDPLAYVIKKGHERDLTIHAWVNVYFVWASDKPPRALHHLFNRYPNWIDTNGKNDDSSDNDENENKGEGYFLAPHHPQVQKHLLAVFRELTALYNIDGLHLDYIRFQDSEYGNNDFATSYYTKNNISLEWNNYRRSAITNLVKETKEMLLDVRPNCKLSAAVKPNLLLAKNRFYQEWDVWLAAGYLDWVMPMNYTPDLRDFAGNIDIMYDHLPKKYRHKIMMGIALYNQPPMDAIDKINYSEITRFRGISIFSYNVFKEVSGYSKDLFNP